MPNLPIPCINCLRFHFGTCREFPKQCFQCGRMNHIERFCPQRLIPHFRWNPKEPIPGTREWCKKYQLDRDPELRQRIINAIKASPGCAIWLNGAPIYSGNEQHFSSDIISRGNRYGGRTSRNRSMSPLRDITRQRSRSPLRRNRKKSKRRDESQLRTEQTVERGRLSKTDLLGYEITSPHRRNKSPSHKKPIYRSRSPLIRQSPGPNRRREVMSRLRTAIYDEGSTSPVDTKQLTGIQQPQLSPLRGRDAGISLFSYHPAEPRPAVKNVTYHSSTTAAPQEAQRKEVRTYFNP